MRFILLLAVGLLSVTANAGSAERAQAYNRYFYPHGTPSSLVDDRISPGISQTRELRTVLPGVLYRGGGPGGAQPLPDGALMALCRAGFSLAVYTYTDGWDNPSPVSCTNQLTGRPNTIHYIAGDVLDGNFKTKFLTRVREVVENPSLGPVFVHCWNGFHASGEYAAIALRQFCGWSGDRASAYWLRHANGLPLISRINRFTPASSLNISAGDQSVLCR